MKSGITSRERVWRAINFQEPDRTPIDIGGTKATGIHVDEYIELGKHLGIDVELPKIYDQYQMLARPDEMIRQRLCSDVMQLENVSETWELFNEDWKVWKTGRNNNSLMPGNFNPTTDDNGYISIFDKAGNKVAHMPPNGLYFERTCETSMADTEKLMDPEDWKKSIPLYSEKELIKLAKTSKLLHDYTDYSIHGGFNKLKMTSTGIFAGHTFSDWLCLLLTEKDYVYSILQASAERAIENLKLYLQAVGDTIDTILISTTDYGTQNSELFNPEIFKELYMPNLKLVNDYVHKNSKIKTFYHSCGSVYNIMEYFIQAGVDIINPVQTTAINMDPLRLKQEFGDRIVFWGGGVDTQSVLQFGTVEEVRAQAKERIKIFSPGGGFVFCPVHNIQYGVPAENVVAMIDTVMEFGHYPINVK